MQKDSTVHAKPDAAAECAKTQFPLPAAAQRNAAPRHPLGPENNGTQHLGIYFGLQSKECTISASCDSVSNGMQHLGIFFGL